MLFSVVSNIMKEMSGMLVIFFDVIISVSISIIFCYSDRLILYSCVIKMVVMFWYNVELLRLNE